MAQRFSLLVLATFLLAGAPRENLSRWLKQEAAALPISKAPGETDEERAARVDLIAQEVGTASIPFADGRGWTATELSAAVLILMNEETRFDFRIHAGLPHPVWTQDEGRAACLGQLHKSGIVSPEVWATMTGVGTDRTAQCARYTVTVFVAQARQCGVWYGRRADRSAVAKTFESYGSGGKCAPSDRSWKRADKWVEVIGRRWDRPPVPGYRRATPSEIPEAVLARARSMASGEMKAGKHPLSVPVVDASGGAVWLEERFLLLVEKHANGKLGVSVLVKVE